MTDVLFVQKQAGIGRNKLGAPPTAGDTLVGVASTQTLTNKTLTAPTLTAPVITGAMTIADGATITTPTLTLAVQTVAAAGSNQGDATAITETSGAFINVTGADATKGAKLPLAAVGSFYIVKNNSGSALKFYPNTSDSINALSANTEISLAANVSAIFTAIDATIWMTTPLLPS